MILHFKTRAFIDREQKCTLVNYAPFYIWFCTADQVFSNIVNGELKTPFVLEGETGDAAIGGIFASNSKAQKRLLDHAIRIIESNQAKGLRTGIIPAISPQARPEHGALLILVAHHPESEHVAEQKSYSDYKQLLRDFFNGNSGFYY